MKTLNLLIAAAAISISLVSCQKDNIEPQKPANANNVKPLQIGKVDDAMKAKTVVNVSYEVAIHVTLLTPLCRRYQVEVVDAFGRIVAPPMVFIPTKSTYTFYEQTQQTSGLRMARLVPIPGNEDVICENDLFTTPAGRVIQFRDGVSYHFDLYPKTKTGGEKVINRD